MRLDRASNGTADDWRQADPPPDVVLPVAIASRPQALAESGSDHFRLGEPPPDVVASVSVAERPHSLAADTSANGEADFRDSPTALEEADFTEELVGLEDPADTTAIAATSVVLDNKEIYRIVREVGRADSGDALYSAVSTDRQFGLAFGLVLFKQGSGRLGRVLALMQRRDPAAFGALFDPHAEALVVTTNSPTQEERLAPVGGSPLWSDDWVDKFKRAGAVQAFQYAQNEEAIENQFRPMLDVAFGLGLDTDRGLAMVYDRVVTRGLGGGLSWIVRAAGPLRTPAHRGSALRLLGESSLASFQSRVGIAPTGRFTVETHAALVGALRARGLVPLPTASELIDRLLAAATGPALERLSRLRDSTTLTDVVYRRAS